MSLIKSRVLAALLSLSATLLAQNVAIIERALPECSPEGITTGPDGAPWFGDHSNIGRITTAGVVTEYPLPNFDGYPYGITAGPDGALWFTEYTGNRIGRITTAGAITEYPLPPPESSPYGITAGPDGALWFAEYYGSKIGRISTAGTITEYPFCFTSKPSVRSQ